MIAYLSVGRSRQDFDLHTLLRLRTGLFHAQGVKANVVFLDKKPAGKRPWTERLRVFDLRTTMHFTLKQNRLRREHLQDFVDCYAPGKPRDGRVETERFRSSAYDELSLSARRRRGRGDGVVGMSRAE